MNSLTHGVRQRCNYHFMNEKIEVIKKKIRLLIMDHIVKKKKKFGHIFLVYIYMYFFMFFSLEKLVQVVQKNSDNNYDKFIVEFPYT